MKNRNFRYNNGFIGNVNSAKKIADGVVNLNKKQSVISENYNLTGITSVNYSPPSQWVSLPSFSGITQGFAGVFAVYDTDTNFVTLQIDTSAGNYTVDWGDGTTGSFSDNAIAYKIYTKSSFAGLTSATFDNYKTVLIQAYPVSGTLNGIVLTNNHNQSGFQSGYQYPWLNVQVVGSSCTNVYVESLFYLEQINFIGSNNITSNNSRFRGCRSLKKVINWDTSKCTTFHQMFRYCHALIDVPPLDTRSVTTATTNAFSYMFENCYNLRYVPLFDTSKAVDMENMFAYCYNLATIPSFNTSNVTSMQATFVGCGSIEELPWMDVSKVTNWNSTFRGCGFKKFPKLNTTSITSFSYIFSNTKLFEIENLDTSNATSLYELASRAFSLVKLPETLNINKCTTFALAFYEAGSIKKMPRLIRDGSTVLDLNYWCFNTENLQEVPSFNTNRVSSWAVAFNQSWQLKTVGFTFSYPAGQTWAKADVFNSTFQNCRSLRSIGISDVSGISGSTYTTAYSNMFNSCISLSEVGLSGISENFSIQNCSLGATALNDLYNRLAVVGASGAGAKTITVSGNWGTATDNPAIAIAKGWSVSG